MNLTFDDTGPVDVLMVDAERIDAAGAVSFKDGFRDAITGSDRDVVLDLGQVQFIDSSGLGAIVAAQKLLGKDRVLELADLQEAVSKVMKLTRMDTVFCIHDTVAAARAAHQSSAA